MSEVVPSCMRAPPETVKPTTGRPSSVARSKVRQIFSPTTEPIEPIMNSAFMKKRAQSWPPTLPRPQTTPSFSWLFSRASASFSA